MILEDKKILVTGGSLGIGLEISKKIATEGGIVTMIARNKKNLIEAINILKEISDKNHNYIVADVSKLKKYKKIKKIIKNNNFDGLINCAGIYGPIGNTKNVNMKKFHKTIKINLMGTVYMCNAFINSNSQNKRKIITFSGGGGTSPHPNYSAYAASKAAIIRFTENLAIELGNDFDVNCIAPGFVATRLHQDTIDAGIDIIGEKCYNETLKSLGENHLSKFPELAIFLLSNNSDGITGKIISAVWDNWGDKEFQNELKSDSNFATLRRIDDKNFISFIKK
ncbi:SDR family oxidoreductase [Candidatus Dojkabacteria bacterium]|jgi:3-oxoacyl-[acyl-carrier protein] reductase|nr:SDR family oxidoreductase [Candidatus Dojkabacteria bacterium]